MMVMIGFSGPQTRVSWLAPDRKIYLIISLFDLLLLSANQNPRSIDSVSRERKPRIDDPPVWTRDFDAS